MKKPKKPWAPVPVAVQVTRHKKALAAAAKKVHTSKAASAKRSAAAKKAAATRAKHRKWSPDEDVALCSARAVAESLRLALGVPVSHDDVLALYWLVADDADAGASILATLDAALSGSWVSYLQPARIEPVRLPISARGSAFASPSPPLARSRPGTDIDSRFRAQEPHQTYILGLDLPYGEPHAVVAHNGLWWSWGEPYSPADFPGAVIEEAWAVTWA